MRIAYARARGLAGGPSGWVCACVVFSSEMGLLVQGSGPSTSTNEQGTVPILSLSPAATAICDRRLGFETRWKRLCASPGSGRPMRPVPGEKAHAAVSVSAGNRWEWYLKGIPNPKPAAHSQHRTCDQSGCAFEAELRSESSTSRAIKASDNKVHHVAAGPSLLLPVIGAHRLRGTMVPVRRHGRNRRARVQARHLAHREQRGQRGAHGRIPRQRSAAIRLAGLSLQHSHASAGGHPLASTRWTARAAWAGWAPGPSLQSASGIRQSGQAGFCALPRHRLRLAPLLWEEAESTAPGACRTQRAQSTEWAGRRLRSAHLGRMRHQGLNASRSLGQESQRRHGDGDLGRPTYEPLSFNALPCTKVQAFQFQQPAQGKWVVQMGRNP